MTFYFNFWVQEGDNVGFSAELNVNYIKIVTLDEMRLGAIQGNICK